MRALRNLLIGIGMAAIWPVYLVVLAYLARVAPWPRGLARPAAFVLSAMAVAAYVAGLSRFLFRPGGWMEIVIEAPATVTKQMRRAILFLLAAALVTVVPKYLLENGLIAPGDRPVSASALARFLGLAFEAVDLYVVCRWGRRKSATMAWLAEHSEHLGRIGRHRRAIHALAVGAIAAVIGLDLAGYVFTARRLGTAGCQSLVLMGCGWLTYRLIVHLVDQQAWRWIRPAHSPHDEGGVGAEGAEQPADLADRLRRLAAWAVPILTVLIGAWVWDIDLELFRTLGRFTIWPIFASDASSIVVTLSDLTESVIILGVTIAAWHYMSTFFTLFVFPRMPEDQGVRFACLTLSRYTVLGLGTMVCLSELHLGIKEIGVVLAALGVGLGFGLQEIVSNFVCGIILLLERPLRVGDVVTISNNSGRVDRINIRATTIINADNQSIIVPNRAFITGELINWTHKDKVMRLSVKVNVAHGIAPDRVSDLLLTIARDDPDVLRNPVPSAIMESFLDFGLAFVLNVYVPEPSLIGRVRHRLCGQIQKRFEEAGIPIPLPVHEVLLRALSDEDAPVAIPQGKGVYRVDTAGPTPPPPRVSALASVPAEPINRCVDE